jgi:hypothetical protein
MISRSVRANRHERQRPLPGDEILTESIGSLTHAITIQSPTRDVWPWLAQMGAGRAGWYSYDFIDNGRQPSADRIVPELQNLAIGTVFPALPGMTDGFLLVNYEPERFLIIGWPSPDSSWLMTWAFVLEKTERGHTRLIVRARAGRGYHFHRLPWWLAKPVVSIIHTIMQRKQLLGIASRAERKAEPKVMRNSARKPEAA